VQKNKENDELSYRKTLSNKKSHGNLKGIPSSVNTSTTKFDDKVYKDIFDKLRNFKV